MAINRGMAENVQRQIKMTTNKTFNLIVSGYGGQGVLMIAEIIANAAMKQGYDVKEAELHGLAQRGGSLECHVRFGRKIYSPLVMRGSADLIISLEALEALRSCYWADKDTSILVNKKTFNIPFKPEQLVSRIKKITKKISVVDADAAVEKLTGDIINVNIFMLGLAVKKKLLPLKKENVWKAIAEKVRPQFLEENKKVFNKALAG